MNHTKLVQEFLRAKRSHPGRCDQKIFDEGEFLCILAGPRMWTIEAWVKKVAKLAKAKIDWHFLGGRACVYYLGGPEALKRIIEAAEVTKPAFEEASQILADRHEADRKNTEWAYPVQWLNVAWGVVPV